MGHLGIHHLRHLSSIEGFEVSGIFDISPDAGRIAAEKFQVSVFDDINELIEASDVLDVVTPTSTHSQIGHLVIQAGKPLFIEKPVCATVSEAMKLVEFAKTKGIPIQVGHIERFNRAFRGLNRVKVKPKFIEAHRLATFNPRGNDVAVVLDLMIHDLDLILSLTTSEPVAVYASGVPVISDSIDIANARIEFADGLVANITASRISLKRMRKLRLFGQQEYIAVDMDKGECEYVGGTFNDVPIPDEAESVGTLEMGEKRLNLFHQSLTAVEDDAMKLELTAFRDCLIHKTAPLVTGEDGLRALRLAELIIEKIKC